MTQTDYATISLLQSVKVQSQQSTTTNETNGKDQDFRTLLKDKYQTAADSNTSAEAGNVITEKKRAGNEEDDPLTQQLACAQFLTLDTPVVQVVQTQEQPTVEAETLLSTDALTSMETVSQLSETATPVVQQDLPDVTDQQPQQTTEVEAAPVEDPVETVPVDTAPAQAKTDAQQESDLPTDKGEDDNRFEVTDVSAGGAQPVFQDVEPIMIKVGEAPATEETTQTSDVEQQLLQPLTDALDQGESKVQVQLSPASLGTVTLEVSQQKDGALHVVLTADNAHTRALLQEHAENLQNLLGSQGQKTVQVEVARQENTQQQDGANANRNGHGQNGYQQEQQQQRHSQSSEDFLQQLRLGLIPLDGEGN